MKQSISILMLFLVWLWLVCVVDIAKEKEAIKSVIANFSQAYHSRNGCVCHRWAIFCRDGGEDQRGEKVNANA
jgi:hypothetical protein